MKTGCYVLNAAHFKRCASREKGSFMKSYFYLFYGAAAACFVLAFAYGLTAFIA